MYEDFRLIVDILVVILFGVYLYEVSKNKKNS